MPTDRNLPDTELPRDLIVSLASFIDRRVERAVAERLAGVEADPLVPHSAWPGMSRRRAADVARSGALEGATRRGKTWYVRRSVLNAYLAAGEPPAAANGDDIDAALERALARAR